MTKQRGEFDISPYHLILCDNHKTHQSRDDNSKISTPFFLRLCVCVCEGKFNQSLSKH